MKKVAILKKAAVIIGVIMCIAGGSYLAYKTIYKAYVEYYMPNNETVSAFNHNETILLVGDKKALDMNPKFYDGRILLPIEAVKKYIDKNILWDKKQEKVTVTTENKVIRMKTDSLQAYINNNPVRLDIPVVILQQKVYIPIEFLADFYSIEVKFIEETNVVIVDYKNRMIQKARVITDQAVLRNGRSVKKPIVSKLKYGDTARVFARYKDWYRVRLDNGTIGYLNAEEVEINWITALDVPYEIQREITWRPDKGKINLSWHYFYSKTSDMSKEKKIKGLDVLSPGWFYITDDKGNMKNIADKSYTKWAHDQGYKVWALVANNFSDAQQTSTLLNSTEARDNFIRQLLAFASIYDLDGINFDFENVLYEDRDMLTQLIREATPLLKEQGLIVSIDVGVPDGSETYSLCYDHEELAKIVDFVMVMTYDQHWHNAPTAGSVAQYDWVEDRLKRTLEMVPNEKLLLGIPFYSRLWKETTESGEVSVETVKTPSIEGIRNIVEASDGYKIEWDDESGQFYFEYRDDDVVYKMWIEDKNSLNLKTSLVLKYNLAGVSSWNFNCASDSVWQVIYNNLKESDSYEKWLKKHENVKYTYHVDENVNVNVDSDK